MCFRSAIGFTFRLYAWNQGAGKRIFLVTPGLEYKCEYFSIDNLDRIYLLVSPSINLSETALAELAVLLFWPQTASRIANFF